MYVDPRMVLAGLEAMRRGAELYASGARSGAETERLRLQAKRDIEAQAQRLAVVERIAEAAFDIARLKIVEFSGLCREFQTNLHAQSRALVAEQSALGARRYGDNISAEDDARLTMRQRDIARQLSELNLYEQRLIVLHGSIISTLHPTLPFEKLRTLMVET